MEKTTPESDEAAPHDTEFVLEDSFQLGPQCESIGPALLPTRIVRFTKRIGGIYSGLLLFGRG